MGGASIVQEGFGEQCTDAPMPSPPDESVSVSGTHQAILSHDGGTSERSRNCIPSVPGGSCSGQLPSEQDHSQMSPGSLDEVAVELAHRQAQAPKEHAESHLQDNSSSAQQPGVSSDGKVPIPTVLGEPKLEDSKGSEECAAQGSVHANEKRVAVVARESSGEPGPAVQVSAVALGEGDGPSIS